jgi:hypothetical protein
MLLSIDSGSQSRQHASTQPLVCMAQHQSLSEGYAWKPTCQRGCDVGQLRAIPAEGLHQGGCAIDATVALCEANQYFEVITPCCRGHRFFDCDCGTAKQLRRCSVV